MRKVAALVALTIGEGLVVLAWLTASTVSVIVIVQVLVAAVLAVAALAARYVSMRAQYLDEVATRAAEIERSRLAEDMHDALGHELSLIAVQAGALQLSYPDTSDRSAAIRKAAERATLALREIVSVLPATHLPGTLEPTADSLDAIVSRARGPDWPSSPASTASRTCRGSSTTLSSASSARRSRTPAATRLQVRSRSRSSGARTESRS
ncbi:MAG: histidine kinase dimerization/phosphoacceptor domain-containing protein [Nocardioidaceae bacterium]